MGLSVLMATKCIYAIVIVFSSYWTASSESELHSVTFVWRTGGQTHIRTGRKGMRRMGVENGNSGTLYCGICGASI